MRDGLVPEVKAVWRAGSSPPGVGHPYFCTEAPPLPRTGEKEFASCLFLRTLCDPGLRAVKARLVGRGAKEWLRCEPALLDKSGTVHRKTHDYSPCDLSRSPYGVVGPILVMSHENGWLEPFLGNTRDDLLARPESSSSGLAAVLYRVRV